MPSFIYCNLTEYKIHRKCNDEESMINSHHKKIAIIGCAGSGKTTLSLYLQEQLNLPLYHLDQYYWKPGWERSEFEEFNTKHAELCEQKEWIIEGSYYRLFYYRACFADIIIFLDVPRFKCLWYVIKRSMLNWGKIIPGNPKECKQELFSFKFLEFLYWIWTFNKRYRSAIMRELNELKDEKQIYILTSLKEKTEVLKI